MTRRATSPSFLSSISLISWTLNMTKDWNFNDRSTTARVPQKKGRFYMDNFYVDQYASILGPVATAVYMSLCRHADNNRVCFPSQELIARKHHLSQRTVRRAIQRLREASIIVIRRNKARKGKWRNNIYVLLDRNQWKSPEDINGSWVTGQKRPTPEDKKDKTRGHYNPIKDTHKKDTHIKDTKVIDIFSLNEEGGWIRPSIPRSYRETEIEDETKRQLTGIRKELSERLGWRPKGSRNSS